MTRLSRTLLPTLKDPPADAEAVSHKLLVRAGMIRQVGAGLWTYLPAGLRSHRKAEQIIREEMNRIGGQEISMPILQPADAWQKTGRYGIEEMFKLEDRKGSPMVLAMTAEECVTGHVSREVRSYRDLPQLLYQIQTKERDEPRPRAGVLRTREFMMKDAYSFDRDRDSAQASYQVMAAAYRRIFDRFGLTYRAVAADSGAIGGDLSEEFQVIAATGEDAIIYCPDSDYAANIEKAEALPPQGPRPAPSMPLTKVLTPGKTTCAAVAEQLGTPLATQLKSLVLASDEINENDEIVKTQVWLLLLRADHEMNEVKVGKLPGLDLGFRLATEAEILEHFGCRPGYLGPLNLRKPVNIVADREVMVMADMTCGANEADYHLTGVNWGRDLPEPDLVADIRNVVAGDLSPDGKGVLAIERGIEVGHVFYLGSKYSRAMNATFLAEDGKPRHFEMGCYGIGVTRLPAAAIEQNHDARGIIWPDAIAPFTVVICPIGMDRSEAVREAAEKLHGELLALGVDVMLDDRGERPGAMFADWELIGVPHRVTIGDKGLKEGLVEYQHRRDEASTKVGAAEVLDLLKGKLGL